MISQKEWDEIIAFHGHSCPGVAVGVKAVEAAREKIGVNTTEDEDIVCVTENDACGVDAIQYMLSCTIGKGNLIYRDTGKMAFSFFDRVSGKKIRMVLKPMDKSRDREEQTQWLLESPVDEIFTFSEPNFELPEKARLFETVICEECGEGAPEHKIRLQEGQKVCLDCFKPYDRGR